MSEVFTNTIVDFNVNLLLYKVLTDKAVKRHGLNRSKLQKKRKNTVLQFNEKY